MASDPRLQRKRPRENNDLLPAKRPKLDTEQENEARMNEQQIERIFELEPKLLAKAVALLGRIIENIKVNPCEKKFRNIKYQAIRCHDDNMPGILDFLSQCGFQMQKHDVIRLVLEEERLDRFEEACLRFDRVLARYAHMNGPPDQKLEHIKNWLVQNKFKLSENAKSSLSELKQLPIKNLTERDTRTKMDLLATVSSEVPFEYALGDCCAKFTAEIVLKYIKQGLILDVGCGVGDFGTHIKQGSGPSLDIHGVDISPVAVQHAAKTRAYSSLSPGDVNEGLTMRANIYDAVVSSNCILMNDRLYPTAQSLIHLVKVIKPGGYLIAGRRVRKDTDVEVYRHFARFEAVGNILSCKILQNDYVNKEYRVVVWQKAVQKPTPSTDPQT